MSRIRLLLVMPRELKEAVRKASFEQQISMVGWVYQAVREYLDTHEPNPGGSLNFRPPAIKGSVRFTFDMDREMDERLAEFARVEGTSRAAIIRRAILHRLRREGLWPEGE